jgi:ribosomal protein S6--L-glutamate ligase
MILSRAPGCYSTRRLVYAARQRGHDARVCDTTHFSLLLERGTPSMSYRGEPLPPRACDAVIPRIGASITFFGTAVVRQFQQMGVFCLNGAEAITDARDKLRTLQLLSRHDIGIPPTAFVRCHEYTHSAIASVGGAPMILKLLEGTQGVGVILAESGKVAEAIIETLRRANQNVLIQRFVSESRGRDIRAFVVGGRVIAAMRRVAQGAEYRSNVHRGGRAVGVDLSPEFERTAVEAAEIVGLHIAGVDMLESADGPKITEVNCSPGLEGIEGATGVDIAGAIMDYLQEHVPPRVRPPQVEPGAADGPPGARPDQDPGEGAWRPPALAIPPDRRRPDAARRERPESPPGPAPGRPGGLAPPPRTAPPRPGES